MGINYQTYPKFEISSSHGSKLQYLPPWPSTLTKDFQFLETLGSDQLSVDPTLRTLHTGCSLLVMLENESHELNYLVIQK